MYRTQPLGLIYDTEVNSYRPLYKAFAISNPLFDEVSGSKNIALQNYKSIKETNKKIQLVEANRPQINIMQKQSYARKLILPSEQVIPLKIIEIDARVKSPQPNAISKQFSQSKFLPVSPFVNKEFRSKQIDNWGRNSNINRLQKHTDNSILSSSHQKIKQVVIRKLTDYSQVEKSIWQPSTRIVDSGAIPTCSLTPELQQLLDLLKSKSIQTLNAQQKHYFQQTIRNLETALNNKSREMLDLQNKLTQERVRVANASHSVRIHQQQLKKEQDYGNESRKKLKAQIDLLKENYSQLVKRVQEQGEFDNSITNYKQLYQQAQKELREFKKKTFKQSVQTQIFPYQGKVQD